MRRGTKSNTGQRPGANKGNRMGCMSGMRIWAYFFPFVMFCISVFFTFCYVYMYDAASRTRFGQERPCVFSSFFFTCFFCLFSVHSFTFVFTSNFMLHASAHREVFFFFSFPKKKSKEKKRRPQDDIRTFSSQNICGQAVLSNTETKQSMNKRDGWNSKTPQGNKQACIAGFVQQLQISFP